MGLLGHPFKLISKLFVLFLLGRDTTGLVNVEYMCNVGVLIVKPSLLKFPLDLMRLKSLIQPWLRRL